MSTIVYRDARGEDAAALAAFPARSLVVSFGHLYPPEDLAVFLDATYGEAIQRAEIVDPQMRYHLAMQGERLVGYVMMGALDMNVEEREALELHRLYVDTDMKGVGVARVLMDAVLTWARGNGAPALYLSVWENNERAQRFYKRYGFEHVGEHKFMVGKSADRDFIWRLAL